MIKLPVLYTPRLILREICLGDAEDMFYYAQHPLVGPNAGWAPHTSIQETRRVIQLFLEAKKRGEPGVFAIIDRQTGRMIGTIELFNLVFGFKAELGYALSPDYWGRGIIPEAAESVLEYGFHVLQLKRIEASAFLTNYQSQRVCEKLGFIREGVARNGYLRYDGKIIDKEIFGLTDTEYEQLTVNR